VNQRQVAHAMGKEGTCVARCCGCDVGRLLPAVGGDLEQWSGDFDDSSLARWLVLRLGWAGLFLHFAALQGNIPLPNLTELLLSYTPSRARPFAALRTPFITDSWPTCALGLCVSPFTRYLRKEM
jgi:hypothetical protein